MPFREWVKPLSGFPFLGDIMTINYVPAKDRRCESCDDCIGNSEGYFISCLIDNEMHRKRNANSGFMTSGMRNIFGMPDKSKSVPCKYHMTSEQYIALIDSLEEEYE